MHETSGATDLLHGTLLARERRREDAEIHSCASHRGPVPDRKCHRSGAGSASVVRRARQGSPPSRPPIHRSRSAPPLLTLPHQPGSRLCVPRSCCRTARLSGGPTDLRLRHHPGRRGRRRLRQPHQGRRWPLHGRERLRRAGPGGLPQQGRHHPGRLHRHQLGYCRSRDQPHHAGCPGAGAGDLHQRQRLPYAGGATHHRR